MALIQRGALRPSEVLSRYGKCLELIPLDKHFNDISIGLYLKESTFTVWTFSNKPNVSERIKSIRNQLVSLGGMSAVPGTDNQARFECGSLHERPVKFLLSQSVGKAPDFAPSSGEIKIKDSKSDLTIYANPFRREGSWFYRIATSGNAKNPSMRLRMIMAGFSRYGEMDKEGENEVAFECRNKHEKLMRLLMPYSRNISSVETMIAAEDMRGQMTTNTLGFNQT